MASANDFGKGVIRAPLIKDFQNILQQYPDDGQILKELIQNAEDAGAKTVKFMYDKSKYGDDPDSLYEPELADHQGPALYAYNDAVFSAEDWTGLRTIRDSIKAKDPLKVGRFGLGFKSVFHLTDLPGILSGNQVGYLDPQEQYFTEPEVIQNASLKKRRRREIPTSSFAWRLEEKLLHEFQNQFKPFIHELFGVNEDTFRNGNYRGTLFRFPLRHKPSEISETKYTSEKVKILLDQLQNEGHYMLLFLKEIEKIEFYEKENIHTEPHLKYSITLSDSSRKGITERKLFMKNVKTAQLNTRNQLSENSIHCSYYLETELRGQRSDNTDNKKQWLVTQYYRKDALNSNSESLPLVGIALPLNETVENDPKGHVFCVLPMPFDGDNKTGMHIHLNGCFAIDQNRKHLKWPTDGQSLDEHSTDKELKWNRHLIKDLIPEAMIELLEFSVNSSSNQEYFLTERTIYQIFPDIQKLKGNWKPVYDKFVHHVQSRKCLYSMERTWIKPSDGYVISDVNPSYAETVRLVARKGHIQLVEAPIHIVQMLSQNMKQINPDHIRNVMLTCPTSDIHLSTDERNQLVVYFMYKGSVAHLDGLELLTLLDGTCTTFKSPSGSECLWLESDECPATLVPCITSSMICCTGNKSCEIYKALVEIAKSGKSQIKILESCHIPKLLQHVFRDVDQYTADTSPLYVGNKWLEEIWNFIVKYEDQISIAKYEGLPIVPLKANQWGTLTNCISYIAKGTTERSIEETGITATTLEKLGLVVVDWQVINTTISFHQIQDYVAPPTIMGVLAAFIKVSYTNQVDQLTDEERVSFRNAICANALNSKIQNLYSSLLRKLPLIKCYATLSDDKERWGSADEVSCCMFNYAVPLPKKVGKLQECEQFAKIVAVKILTSTHLLLHDVFPYIHEGYYSKDQVQEIMQYVLTDIEVHCENDRSFPHALSQIPFMSTNTRESVRPCDLIDPSDSTIKELFNGLDIFPTGHFSEREILRKLSYHGVMKKISSDEILALAKYLNEGSHQREKSQALELLKYLNNNSHNLLSKNLVTNLIQLRWVPVKADPPQGYPKELKWYGTSNRLVFPCDLVSMEYEYTVSSTRPVLPIRTEEINQSLKAAFNWEKMPALQDVINHLQNVTEASINNAIISFLVNNIYKVLNKYHVDELRNCLKDCKNWVWTGENFTNATQAVLEKSKVKLEPYLYQMPHEFLKVWKIDTLQQLGIQDSIAMTDILNKIKEHHSSERRPTWESKRDLKICFDIYEHLRDEKEAVKADVLIPVKTTDETLKLEPMKYCVYCDQETYRKKIDVDDVLDNEDGQDIYEIHEDMPIPLAKYIGVSSLIKRYIDADPLPVTFGQGEPLTRRIKSLLDDYTDGSSVLKELIQNADDAGASQVSFIYDTRDFSGDSGLLLDEKMRPLQGHSLLCHNNAEFTEQDFENIVKISGATKKGKTDKIGRFGLGFNAVYNLTDVPSFVSGSNIVIFDPQTKHLGDTIKDPLQPGIKLNFERHGKKIQRLKSQFQPFQDVMGCKIQQLKRYNGTLFRFPLRTQKQADESEISKKCYNLFEVQGLFSVFRQMAHEILLFTQNVNEVMFYEMNMSTGISARGCIKKEMICVVKPMTHSETINLNDEMRVLKHSQNSRHSSEKLRNHIIVKTIVKLQKGDIFCQGHESVSIWSISNALGNAQSKELLKTNKDCIPVGGIAVELVALTEGKLKMKLLRSQGVCEGQMYCFLPLPLKSGVPFHINGYFAISSNRKQLCTQDFGDKDSEKALWNTALMQDHVTEAFVSLISDMVQHNNIFESKSLLEEIFNIFPVSIPNEMEGKSNLIFQLSKSFYERITTDISICPFPSGNGWTNFEKSKFLDPQLTAVESRELGQVGKAIFAECGSVLQRDDTFKLVNLPLDVMKQMKVSDLENRVKEKVIYLVHFYEHIFLPNIKTRNVTNRDKLLLFAILECDNSVDDIVKSSCCIPVSSSEGFMKPGQLVDPSGPLKDLYDTEDGPFPIWLHGNENTKVKRKVQLALQELGMRTCELTDDEIIDRANTIQHLTPERGEKRCRCLLELLSRENASNESLMARLKPIKILPVAKKPNDWYLSWYSDQYQGRFLSMDDAFPVEQSKIVGCSELLATFPIVNYPLSLAKKLGYVRKEIRLSHLDVQFKCVLGYVSKADSKMLNHKEKQFLKSVMIQIYEHLNSLAEMDNDVSREITKMYSSAKIIMVDCKIDGIKFISPEICAKEQFDGAPFLYTLPAVLQRHLSFQKALTIQEIFSYKTLVLALQSIANRERKVKKNTMTVVRNISEMLSEQLKTSKSNRSDDALKQYGDIYLPDAEGIMTVASDLCYNNCPWYHTRERKFLNVKITFEQAQNLGVKTFRQQMLGKCQKGIPFGQHEKLTNRIRRILDGYPCDKEILKELLQNADDAGASEIHFILDYRRHKTEKLFNDEWKSLQGPALLVYNDKPFTKADLEGIQNLGEGSKSFDPLTTGKYGVGFNCVYNLTDTPTFLTADPDNNGDHILVALDPQCKYVPGSTNEYPGQMWNDLENTRKMFPDVFECYNLPIETKGGTVFRFPLRTDAMACFSDISPKAKSTSDVKELFGKFSESLEDCLLFLTNVRKISLSEIRNANGKVDLIGKVKANVNAKGMNSKNRFFDVVKKSADAVKKCSLEKVEFSQCTYQLDIDNSNGHKSQWLVVQQVGFRNIQNISKDVIANFKENKASLLPRGGVAYCLGYHVGHQTISSTSYVREGGVEKSAKDSKPKTSRNLYCFLPLPIEVQFPMHLNGYFALDHESRRNLWVNENMTGFKVEWNKLVFGEVIADSYNTALEYVRDSMPRSGQYHNISYALDKFCKIFSIYPREDYYLQYLEDCIYKDMLRRKIEFLPVICRKKYWHIHNKLPFSENVEVVWHPVSVEGEFVYFDDLTSQIKEPKRSSGYMPTNNISYGHVSINEPKEETIKKADFVRNVLHNSNFPFTYAPINLLKKLLKASDKKVKTALVSPSGVMKFFKTKATLLGLPLPIDRTPFIDKRALSEVLEYCKNNLDQLEGLPMLLSGDGFLHTFTVHKQLLLTPYKDLIPGKQDLFADSIFLRYENLENIERYLKPMKCEDLATLLPFELSKSKFYGEDKIVKLDLKNVSNLQWLIRLWSFISTQVWCMNGMVKSFDGTQLQHLTKWCIIPVKSNIHELWPLARATEVVSSNSQPPPGFDKILQKMSFPEPFVPVFCANKDLMISTLHHIVANFERPESILIALTQAQRKFSVDIANLGTSECLTILQYFNQSLDSIRKMNGAKERLKQLPFYRKKDGTKTSLNLCIGRIYTIPNEIPTAQNWTEESGNTYLDRCIDLDDLYTFIDVCHLNKENAYCDHILHFFHRFTEQERFKHLIFLKRLIEENEYNDKPSNNKRLISVLRSVPLLNDSNGKLLPVSSFYDPNNVVFKRMETNFPRPPFNDYNWISFFKRLGLVFELTGQLILRYAHQIAEQARIIQPKDAMLCLKDNSKALWKEVISLRQNLLSEVNQNLKVIAFLPARDTSENLRKLCQPHRHPLFIALNDSAISEYEVLEWTQRPVLQEWVYKQNMSELGVVTKPNINDVLNNLTAVCDSPQVTHSMDKETEALLLAFLKKTFRYITDHHMHHVSSLQHIACVPILGGTELLKPTQLSVKMPEIVAKHILPYMALFPLETMSEFLQLFQNAGTTMDATAEQYCDVLKTIYTENAQQELEPNALTAVLFTLKGLFELNDIQNMGKELKSLHLLGTNNKMYLSSEVVYIDWLRFKRRLKSFPIPIFFSLEGDKDLGLSTQIVRRALRSLHKEIKPMFISEIVTECLEEECLATKMKSDKCLILQEHIKSDEFANGLIRIIRSESHSTSLEDDNEDLKLVKVLSNIQFFELSTVTTYLEYQGGRIPQSEDLDKPFFIRRNEFYEVYLSMAQKCKDTLYPELCKIINIIMKGKTETKGILVQEIVKCSTGEIEEVLNTHNVPPYDAIMTNKENQNSQCLGEYVPIKFHHLLKPAVQLLRLNEIVAYEVYDPLDEKFGASDVSEEELKENSVYRYAKIMEIESNDESSYTNYKYKIYLGDDEFVVVHSSELYRFQRRVVPLTTGPLVLSGTQQENASASFEKKLENFEEIKKKITEILEEAWKMEEPHKRKIIKRLFLEWHPDKNPDCIELATEVFKFIQNEIERLEKGLTRSDLIGGGGYQNRNKGKRYHKFDFNHFYGARARSHNYYSNQYEKEYKSHGTSTNGSSSGSSSSSYFTPPRFKGKNPQPTEARRWMKQAYHDLQAVPNDIEQGVPSYEWACFKCHQAAEKALKATQFAVDSALKDNQHTLSNLCDGINDPECISLATNLESLVGSSASMRYPDRHYGGQTNHDAYDKDKAAQTKEYAEQILQKCRDFIAKQ